MSGNKFTVEERIQAARICGEGKMSASKINRKTYPHRVYLFPLVDTLTKETEECTRREN